MVVGGGEEVEAQAHQVLAQLGGGAEGGVAGEGELVSGQDGFLVDEGEVGFGDDGGDALIGRGEVIAAVGSAALGLEVDGVVDQVIAGGDEDGAVWLWGRGGFGGGWGRGWWGVWGGRGRGGAAGGKQQGDGKEGGEEPRE